MLKNSCTNTSNNLHSILKMLSSLYNEKCGKKYIVWKVIDSIVDSIISFSYIIIPGLIINELTSEIDFFKLVLLVCILAFAPLLNYLKNISIGMYLKKVKMKLIRIFNIKFQEHIADMEYETLEKPDVRVLKQRAGVTAPAPIYMFDRLIPLFSAMVSLGMMSSVIFTLHPLIIVLIIFVVFINSVVTKKINDKNFEHNKEVSIYNNLYYTHFYDLADTSSAKEIRLYNLKNFFINLFTKDGVKIDQILLKSEAYKNKMQIVHIFTGLIQQVILYSYLVYIVIKKNLAIGSMTIYLSTVSKISNTLTVVFNQYLDIKNYCMEISEYIEFMRIPTYKEKSGDLFPIFNADSIIEFKNVSFKYPSSERYALKDINLKIYGNKKICIVGSNGSGKTTLIKLITRLYEPTEGEILLNGINVNEYNINEYSKIFAPVFQDYYLYNLSVAENIALSHEYNISEINEIMIRSGLVSMVERSNKGCKTQVWKNIEADGIEPSGGEGQKMAIARAIFRNASLYLLDEPTASLDPNAEYEIYCNFNKLIKNKAAVLITHRLSAVQLADEIVVFDKGKLVEQGTHNDLYGLNGIYAKMFDKQAEFYRQDIKVDYR